MRSRRMSRDMLLFFIVVALAALGNGLSDSVYANYFRDAYRVTAEQRAFIEFPRELPGLLCMLVVALLAGLGDVRTALVAQLLAAVGLLALGLLTPSFSVMLIFLFINSMGMHLFMPLQESIGMALAEPGQLGRRVGQYASLRMLVGFVSGTLVFFGFRFGFFSFKTPLKLPFLIGAASFLLAALAASLMSRGADLKTRPKGRIVFRKAYRWYYLLTLLNGVQKQMAYVFGSWFIVDVLMKGADLMSILMIIAAFVSIFFTRVLGHLIDRLGIQRMMLIHSLVFLVVYSLYGLAVMGIQTGLLPAAGLGGLIIYALFISDRLSMQMGVVRSVYLKSIAVSPEEITNALSTGISLDHLVSIIAALLLGQVWKFWGPQWVFFLAASLSLGNLFVALKVKAERAETE